MRFWFWPVREAVNFQERTENVPFAFSQQYEPSGSLFVSEQASGPEQWIIQAPHYDLCCFLFILHFFHFIERIRACFFVDVTNIFQIWGKWWKESAREVADGNFLTGESVFRFGNSNFSIFTSTKTYFYL